ncbi:MAG: ribosomal protein S18-alanine N-acetyltransferase [Deltaproteobacteria bacterium]|jgi:ribosomal-protein-alanine N-acetyltransferase|nr:ribosomal protein S18-alanine N-acetyltransferase [Deltaproteobacteria bacterium]
MEAEKRASEVLFRALGEDDLDSVLALEETSFSMPWSREQYSLMLRAGACNLFGALAGSEVVAYACVSLVKAAAELEVYNIAVRADKRRQGLGQALLSTVLAAADALGVKRAVLEVRESNLAAIHLYENLGFKLGGKRRSYYTAPDEDALVYVYEWQTLPETLK